ncbi:MAG: glycosyltransferase family 4 protein [Phycisphaerales bacterium]|nr:glycosyltransferase family 4 protein [Phycisphaerales bacterium]
MNLRILHISTRLIQGGSQENTILSCEGQAELGHEVHLAYGPIFGPEGTMLDRVHSFRTREDQSIGAHEVPHMVREIAPIKDAKCYLELKRLIHDLEPDIVHTHSSKAGILGRAAAWSVYKNSKNKRPAVIHTIHGPPFHKYLNSTKNTLYIASEQFAAKRCHAIVSVADAMIEQFLGAKIGDESQYVTVRSGMEVEKFLQPEPGEDRASMRARLGFTDDDFVIGTVARLAEHKGHDDILDGLANDLRANPNWKLLWIGNGWWADRLLGRVKELGLENQVVSTGLVAQDKVASMMRAMDVLLHPSYREGLPRTVPQALLCSVPVAATTTDGTPEVCIDPGTDPKNATGVLFPVANPTALRDAVCWLHDHPKEREAMGQRGRVMCASMFSAQTMVNGLEKVYADALSRC